MATLADKESYKLSPKKKKQTNKKKRNAILVAGLFSLLVSPDLSFILVQAKVWI